MVHAGDNIHNIRPSFVVAGQWEVFSLSAPLGAEEGQRRVSGTTAAKDAGCRYAHAEDAPHVKAHTHTHTHTQGCVYFNINVCVGTGAENAEKKKKERGCSLR